MRTGQARRAAKASAFFGSILLVPLLLSGCASAPPCTPLIRDQVVEVPVEVVRPVPSQLTDPIPYPDAIDDSPTMGELVDRLMLMYDLLDQANSDRESVRKISAP